MFTQLPSAGNDSSMTVERRDRIKVVSEATTLDVSDQIVDCEDGTYTVTLPSVAGAGGKAYSIYAPATVTGAITVAHKNSDSRDYQGPWTLDAANDSVLLYSDGMKWWPIADNIAP